jgi:hypothetical protein
MHTGDSRLLHRRALPNLVVLRWLRWQPYLVDLRYIRRRDLLVVVRRAASRSGTVG